MMKSYYCRLTVDYKFVLRNQVIELDVTDRVETIIHLVFIPHFWQLIAYLHSIESKAALVVVLERHSIWFL